MESAAILSIALALVATLFGILMGVTGWFGNRVMIKQDEMLAKLDVVKEELNDRIFSIDIRLVRVETLFNSASHKTHE